MSFLDRIRTANHYHPGNFRPFRVCGRRVGFIPHAFAETLTRWPQVFRISSREVTLNIALEHPSVSLEQRSAAVDEVIRQLWTEQGYSYWWDEAYAVNTYFGEPPFLLMERAALQLFGICGYGVHLNGYVRTVDGLELWVAKRALDKATDAGKLDQLAAGGHPHGLGLKQNMIKECAEEAAIPFELADRMIPVSATSYCLETEFGLRPDVLYNFDLELPAGFAPVNADGEVEEFYRWPVEQVMEKVRDGDDFKFNCSLVIIDFLIRHGYISPEHPDYMQLITGLHHREQALKTFPD
jgi:hypothetical protein